MQTSAWVFLGCGVGGVLRHWAGRLMAILFGDHFPFGIMFVNVTGSFLMGLLFVLLMSRWDHLPFLRPLILVGFLGGYTTFSSFSVDTLMLFESGQHLSAVLNILLSVIFCLLSVWLGVKLGRHWLPLGA